MGCLFAPWIISMIGERVVEGLAVNVLRVIWQVAPDWSRKVGVDLIRHCVHLTG
jgi:hypothetical protein